MSDIAKEVVVAALGALIGRIGHKVGQMKADVNAFFQKQRDLELRVKKLEGGDA